MTVIESAEMQEEKIHQQYLYSTEKNISWDKQYMPPYGFPVTTGLHWHNFIGLCSKLISLGKSVKNVGNVLGASGHIYWNRSIFQNATDWILSETLPWENKGIMQFKAAYEYLLLSSISPLTRLLWRAFEQSCRDQDCIFSCSVPKVICR